MPAVTNAARARVVVVAAACALCGLGCAGGRRTAARGTTVAARAGANPEGSVAARGTATPPPPAPPPRPPGPLTRAEAASLVAGGLGTFLARVEVSPVLVGGRFVGFRLDAARDLAEWRAAGADIRIGDVIQRVNGIRIERPEQALWAFERLRIAQAIEVEVRRGAAPVTVRSPIVDAPSARQPGE